jgi:hypothetical protein
MAHVWQVFDGPVVWGRSDCAAAACAVFARLTGINPMAGLRYATEANAARLVARMGGWEAMCAALAARSGLRATQARPGALGLLRPEIGAGLAICVGALWAKRIDGGYRLLPGECIKARWWAPF